MHFLLGIPTCLCVPLLTSARDIFRIELYQAEEIYNLDNSFIAFICGDIDRTIFLPTDTLMKCLPDISHDRNGEYKLNFTRDLNLVLRGKGNTLDCHAFINNWQSISGLKKARSGIVPPDESIHNLIQGRLIEIGNIRGYETYCPDKGRTFNKRRLGEIANLPDCLELQFTDKSLIRKIDALWFRELTRCYYPEYAFEVEISTGVWSGFGRLASLREYNTKLFIISNDERKFGQVCNNFPELKARYINVLPDHVGLLYSAEINLIKMRQEFNL
jgi:hypothetical protein